MSRLLLLGRKLVQHSQYRGGTDAGGDQQDRFVAVAEDELTTGRGDVEHGALS